MDNQDNDFDKIEDAAADRRRQQDFDDLQNEMKGDEVGRAPRFLSAEARQDLIDKRNGKQSRAMNALETLLLNDPGYAVLHKAVAAETHEALQNADMFQQRVDTAIEQTMQDIQATLDQAVTLPNGDKAFMGKDGVAWTQDNEILDPALAAGIDWTGRPMREEHLQNLARLEKLEGLSQEGRVLSTRIGDIYNHIHDEKEPPQADELKGYRDEIKGIEADYDLKNQALQDLESEHTLHNDLETSGMKFTAESVPKL